MTGTPAARMLPLRVPITPGEALDSWLEALARRSTVHVADLAAALGFRARGTAGGLVADLPATLLRRIEDQAGLPAGRVGDAILDPWLPCGAARKRGSRYCPGCLAASDGRWLLAWRLPWVFTCPACDKLLASTCPACGQVPRARYAPSGPAPAGACPSGTGQRRICAADLRQVPQEPAGQEVLAAQRWVSEQLRTPGTEGRESRRGQPDMLADLNIISAWLIRHAPAVFAGPPGTAARAACDAWRAQPASRRNLGARCPPDSAALTAALAVTAMSILTGTDDRAITALRALIPAAASPARPILPGMAWQHWRSLSAPAQGTILRAIDTALSPADQIRYRSGTPAAAVPAATPGQLASRARCVPQLLWPGWAVRLTPAVGFLPVPLRATIAACLLLPGNPARLADMLTGLHAYRSLQPARTMLQTLARAGHHDVLAAISCLAGYLDQHGSPIDYQRRRDLIPARPVTAAEWTELCCAAGAHPARPAATSTHAATCTSSSPAPTCTTPATRWRSPAAPTPPATTSTPTPCRPGCGPRCTTTPPGCCTAWVSPSRSPGSRPCPAAPA